METELITIEHHIILSLLSDFFLKGNVSGISRFQLRKALIRLRACSKTLRDTKFYEGLMIKFNFSDFNKVRACLDPDFSVRNFYPLLKVMRFSNLDSYLYEWLNYNPTRDWTILQWRMHLTICTYHAIIYKGGPYWVDNCLWLDNKACRECYHSFQEKTLENIYTAVKYLTLEQLKSLGW